MSLEWLLYFLTHSRIHFLSCFKCQFIDHVIIVFHLGTSIFLFLGHELSEHIVHLQEQMVKSPEILERFLLAALGRARVFIEVLMKCGKHVSFN